MAEIPFNQQLFAGALSSACAAALVLSLSFALAAVCFDTLMVEAMDIESQRRFRLSDLAALLVVLQVFAGAALAISRFGNVAFWLLGEDVTPLNAADRICLIVTFMFIAFAWWWRNTRMLSGARVESGSSRFTFLAFWTPLGYLSLFSLLVGMALLLGVIASGRAMADRAGWLPAIRIYGVGSAFLVGGFIACFATRFRSKRLADASFRQRMMEAQERIEKTEQRREETAEKQQTAETERAASAAKLVASDGIDSETEPSPEDARNPSYNGSGRVQSE